jgi:hypothetical protein
MSDTGQRKEIRNNDGCTLDSLRSLVDHPHSQNDPSLAGGAPSLLPVDNSDIYHAFRRSLATKNFSVSEEERWPVATLNNPKNNLKAIAQIKPDPIEVEPFLPDDGISEWQQRSHEYAGFMDDLTADVLDVIVAEWLKQASQPESMVVVTADDFLRHRGIISNKGGAWRLGVYK